MEKQVYLQDLKYFIVLPILAMLLVSNSIYAQTTTPDRTEAPFCLVIPSIENTFVEFPLQSTNVTATISGVIASVEIEQVKRKRSKYSMKRMKMDKQPPY